MTKRRGPANAGPVLNRDDRIRTCGPFVPNEVRYQAALHPENFQLNYHSIFGLEWVETC